MLRAASLVAALRCRFTDNVAAATTQQGHPGSISFIGSFYDNVDGHRRGVTSLVWAKPKLKFKVPDGFR